MAAASNTAGEACQPSFWWRNRLFLVLFLLATIGAPRIAISDDVVTSIRRPCELFRSGTNRPVATLSRDGRQIAAVARNEDSILIWSLAEDRLIRTIPARRVKKPESDSTEGPAELFFTANAEHLSGLYMESRCIVSWNVASGQQESSISIPGEGPLVVAASNDGALVACVLKDGIHLFDRQTGNLRRRYDLPPGAKVWRLAFSSDAKQLIAVPRSGVLLTLDVESGVRTEDPLDLPRPPFREEKGAWLWQPALSPTGDTLVAYVRLGYGGINAGLLGTTDKELPLFAGTIVWNVKTRQRIATLSRESNSASLYAISVDGRQIAVATGNLSDPAIEIIDVPSGDIRHRLRGHGSNANSISWSDDGKICATTDHGVFIWDSRTAELQPRFQGHERINKVIFSPDGTTIATEGTEGIRLWDRATLAQRTFVPQRRLVSYPEAKSLLVLDGETRLLRFDIESGEQTLSYAIAENIEPIEVSGPWGPAQVTLEVNDVTADSKASNICYLVADRIELLNLETQKKRILSTSDESQRYESAILTGDNKSVIVTLRDSDTGAGAVMVLGTESGDIQAVWPIDLGLTALSPGSNLMAIVREDSSVQSSEESRSEFCYVRFIDLRSKPRPAALDEHAPFYYLDGPFFGWSIRASLHDSGKLALASGNGFRIFHEGDAILSGSLKNLHSDIWSLSFNPRGDELVIGTAAGDLQIVRLPAPDVETER